jgi:hypothetical protein
VGQKIVDVDLAELSVTPVAVHPGTSFAVVAGKALQEEPTMDYDFTQIEAALDAVERIFTVCQTAR